MFGGMKKQLLLLSALVLLFSAFIYAEGSKETAAGTGVTEITFMHVFSEPRGELIDRVVRDFNNSQDGIVAKHQHVPGWYGGLLEQLQALAVARQLPEVAIMGLSESITMNRQLGAVEIQQYIDRDNYDLSDFFPRFLELAQDQATGKQFVLPYAISTQLIFINRDLLREAGIDPSRQPETWMEINEWAKKVSDPAKGISGIGFQLDFDTWQFQVLLESFGGHMADIDTRRVLFNKEPGPTG